MLKGRIFVFKHFYVYQDLDRVIFQNISFICQFLMSIPCQFKPKIQLQIPFPKLELTTIPIPNSCDPVNSQFQQKSST